MKVNARFDRESKLARAAAGVLCMDCSHSEAMRLAETLDWDILHGLSLAKCVEAESRYAEIGELLVRENKVTMSEFAWTCMAREGRLPADFVGKVFLSTDTKETQSELLKVASSAERQTSTRFLRPCVRHRGDIENPNLDLLEYAVAQTGPLPPDFMARVFPRASSTEVRIKLLHSAETLRSPGSSRSFPRSPKSTRRSGVLRFAENQICKTGERPKGTAMERMLIRTAFGEYPQPVIVEAWSALYRINMGRDSLSRTPFRYTPAAVEELWLLPEFETRFRRLESDYTFSRSTVGAELNRFRSIVPQESESTVMRPPG